MMTDNSRDGFQALLRRAPVWVLFLVIANLWPVLMLGIRWLRGQEISPEVVAIYAAFGLPAAGLLIWLTRWIRARERRKPPGSPTVTNIDEAMSTGRLPEHASAVQWVPELSRIIRQKRWGPGPERSCSGCSPQWASSSSSISRNMSGLDCWRSWEASD